MRADQPTVLRSLRRKAKYAGHKVYAHLHKFFWSSIAPPLRTANYWLTAQVVMLFIALLRTLPPDRALDMADRAARRCGPWFGRHRTAVDNLRRAYPEKSQAEIEAIALDMWGHMARLAAEYIFLDTLYDYDPAKEGQGRISFRGRERFHALAAEVGKPHILFTAHLGSFEMLPISSAGYGTQMTTMFRPPNNPYIARYLLSTRRAAVGELLPSDSGAAFSLAAILERGGNVGVLVDQKFNNGIGTTFFGRECETNPIVPMLARRFGCDVYPARCIRLPGNRYMIDVEPPLEFARNAAGDIDIRLATQQLNDVVERWVREYPAQWTWFHKRWTMTGWRRRTYSRHVYGADAAQAAQRGAVVGQEAAERGSER